LKSSPQPCLAHPDSPKLIAEQGHATFAKHDRFSAFSFLKFRIPRVSASRNRGAHSAFPNKIPPFRPLRAKARPGNAGREQSVPQSSITNLPFRPLRPWREQSAFTLIELMAATTVLSIILLMMVGMQDQMSKAWSNSNRRTDATREARAACLLMSRDLSTFAMRGKAFGRFDSFPTNLTNAGVPFYYSSGPGGLAPGGAPSCAQFFGLIPQPSKTNDSADIALVGYYIAPATNTNVNGFLTTSYNLFRYYIAPSNAAAGIATWLSTPNGNANALFTNIATSSEILARNACNLQIKIYSGTTMSNGFNFSNKGSSSGFYRGNKMGIELSFYPEDTAQKITTTAWMNTNNIQKYARSFEFKIDCPKD
jgi:prepilin-type N-terminal cleavage/methylation domain-containing protein